MHYAIEARQLTSEFRNRAEQDVEALRTVVEASDADEAITHYLAESHAELMSLSRIARSEESIATVKKEDVVFLLRVYSA